jgi:hypothetical protein
MYLQHKRHQDEAGQGQRTEAYARAPGGADTLTRASAAGHAPTPTPRRSTHHTRAMRCRASRTWNPHARARRAPSRRRRDASACTPECVRPGHQTKTRLHAARHGRRGWRGWTAQSIHGHSPGTRPQPHPPRRPSTPSRLAASPPPAQASPLKPERIYSQAHPPQPHRMKAGQDARRGHAPRGTAARRRRGGSDGLGRAPTASDASTRTPTRRRRERRWRRGAQPARTGTGTPAARDPRAPDELPARRTAAPRAIQLSPYGPHERRGIDGGAPGRSHGENQESDVEL